MKRKKVRKLKITRGEKLLYTSAVLCLGLTMILKIFCTAGMSHLSMEVEQLRSQIRSHEKTNESLAMKVSELTSFEKIKDVVSDMGLAYNNDNIVVIHN